ncbi:MAG: sigma factor [Burkholderiaceae bacterium]
MSEDRDIEALLARVGMGDRAAFKSLYDRAAGVMLSTAVRVLQDRTAAEDVVQDVFAGLWHKASDTLAPCTRNLGWLCVVTRNRALDHLRRRPREAPLQVSTEDGDTRVHEAPSEEPGAFEQLAFSQDQQRLHACLKNLPANHGRRSCCATSRASHTWKWPAFAAPLGHGEGLDAPQPHGSQDLHGGGDMNAQNGKTAHRYWHQHPETIEQLAGEYALGAMAAPRGGDLKP